MAFQPCPDIAECDIRMIYDGQQIETVVHAQAPGGGWTLPTLQTLADDILAYYIANFPAYAPPTLQLSEVVVTDLTASNGQQAVAVDNGHTPGTRTAAALPNNATWALKKVTGLRGRSYRGRIYHPCLTNDQVNDNQVDATEADSIKTFYVGLLAQMSTDGTPMVVLSRYQNGSQLANGVGTEVIAIEQADLIVDSQRRRLPGRGR